MTEANLFENVDVWLDIESYPDYQVSNKGEIRSWKPLRNHARHPDKPRLLWQKIDKNGYKIVRLFNGSGSKYIAVHRLVCGAFNGKANSSLIVRHLDGSKDNNEASNLLWGTSKDNALDAIQHGTMPYGEGVNTAKLNRGDVENIRAAIQTSNYSELGRLYKVTPSTIRNIIVGKTWKK